MNEELGADDSPRHHPVLSQWWYHRGHRRCHRQIDNWQIHDIPLTDSWQKQLNEGTISFVLWFLSLPVCTHLSRTHEIRNLCQKRAVHLVASQEAERQQWWPSASFSHLSSLLSVPSFPGLGLATFRVSLPHLVNTLWKHLTDTHTGVPLQSPMWF